MHEIADRFNRSSTAKYLISYKRPKQIIDTYKFQVKLISKLSTSMHASGEGHTCYIFCRDGIPGPTADSGIVSIVPCDPFFKEAWETCKNGGRDDVTEHVTAKVDWFFQEKPNRKCKHPDRLTY